MDELNTINLSEQFAREPILFALINLILCLLILTFVSWFYKKYGSNLSGKAYVTSALPLIGVIVFLLISVIKSSLALSLGLVGALSIVRFRTPIKEPEELAYIFLAIAIGLGYGAGYVALTSVTTIVILLYIYLLKRFSSNKSDNELTLIIESPNKDFSLDNITSIVEKSVHGVTISRFEKSELGQVLVMVISISGIEKIDYLRSSIIEVIPDSKITFIESGVNW